MCTRFRWKVYRLTKILSGNVTRWGLFFNIVSFVTHKLLPSVLQCLYPIGKKIIKITQWTLQLMNFSILFSYVWVFYVCVCVCVFLHAYILCICVLFVGVRLEFFYTRCIHAWMYDFCAYMYAFISVCVCERVFVSVCAWVSLYMFICLCVCILRIS